MKVALARGREETKVDLGGPGRGWETTDPKRTFCETFWENDEISFPLRRLVGARAAVVKSSDQGDLRDPERAGQQVLSR